MHTKKLTLNAKEEEINVKFGAFVQQKRKSKGITQIRLANEADVSPAYICQIEHEQAPPPSEDVVRRIARVLGEDENQMLSIATASRPPRKERIYTEETRRRMSLASSGRRPSAATREKLRKARLGTKDPEPLRLKKCASLAQARAKLAQMRREGIA